MNEPPVHGDGRHRGACTARRFQGAPRAIEPSHPQVCKRRDTVNLQEAALKRGTADAQPLTQSHYRQRFFGAAFNQCLRGLGDSIRTTQRHPRGAGGRVGKDAENVL
jgi:hypothetical protein